MKLKNDLKIIHMVANSQKLDSWIAMLNGEIVGHVYMDQEPNNKIKFLDAWVHEDHRKQGIYRKLWDTRWEYVNENYKGWNAYAWCKPMSLPLLLEKGFIEVMDGPTGFMLIKRDVFVRMAEVYPELKFVPDQHINQSHDKEFDYHKTSDWNYTFFDTMIEPQTKRYLSEDYAFCRLWQNMGGKIYADIMSGMTHYGNYAFRGNVGTQFLPQNNK